MDYGLENEMFGRIGRLTAGYGGQILVRFYCRITLSQHKQRLLLSAEGSRLRVKIAGIKRGNEVSSEEGRTRRIERRHVQGPMNCTVSKIMLPKLKI
jgi:hypothetical protein